MTKEKAQQEILKALGFIFIGVMIALAIFYFSDMTNNVDKKSSDNTGATSTVQTAHESADWPNQISEIRTALGKTFNEVKVEESEPLSIYKRADITGDGVEEALVSLGSGGAYAEYFALMRYENGKPVPAKFKTAEGKTGNVMFLEGTSVTHGMSVELAPSKQAIYSESWNVDAFNTDTIECEIEAYTWNASTSRFEFNKILGKSVTETYCKKIIPPGKNE